MTQSVVFDTDPGHDDAIALLMAAAASEIDLEAVTTVHGNHVLGKTVRNALQILEVAGRSDIPVAAGMATPMVRDPLITTHVHGETGLDGPDLSEPVTEPVETHAVDTIIETVRTREEVTIVAVGPLTNVGMAFRKAPDIVDQVSALYLMGGALGTGNQTPSAEFNILADPEAAAVVFESGVPITMVGLDATHQAILPADRFDEIRGFDSAVGPMVADLLEFYAKFYRNRYDIDGVVIHDALTVAGLVDPGVLETREYSVSVDTSGEHTDGRTVVDVHDVTGAEPNATVAVGVNTERFFEMLFDHLSQF